MSSNKLWSAMYSKSSTLVLTPAEGHIAKLIGMPTYSRHVGQALKFLSPNTNPPVPWYRVIGASGTILSRGPGTQGAQNQADALIAEGVEVTTGRTGELRVDFGRWGWFPQPGDVGLPENGGNEESDSSLSEAST